MMWDLDGRGERIRTSDPLVPNQVLYQAEPLPERVRRMLTQKSSWRTLPLLRKLFLVYQKESFPQTTCYECNESFRCLLKIRGYIAASGDLIFPGKYTSDGFCVCNVLLFEDALG